MTAQPEHVMMTPAPICARCGDYMAFLDRFTPPAFHRARILSALQLRRRRHGARGARHKGGD